MRDRIRVGLLTMGIALTLAILGGYYWVLATMLISFLGYRELEGLMAARQIKPSRVVVTTLGFAFITLATFNLDRYFQLIINIGIGTSFFRLLFRHPRATIADIGGTMIAFCYLGLLPAYTILLRNMGMGYLLFTLLTVAASDIGAYYIGKRFGKSLLSPELSPKKTIEGSIGGLLGAMILGQVSAWLFHIPPLHAFTLSILVGAVSQLGDLSESLIKRDAGLKDSGQLLPGHGGILDRIDSYIFAGPVAYYYVHWVLLHQGLGKELFQLFQRVSF